jgi:hypothetical protein
VVNTTYRVGSGHAADLIETGVMDTELVFAARHGDEEAFARIGRSTRRVAADPDWPVGDVGARTSHVCRAVEAAAP